MWGDRLHFNRVAHEFTDNIHSHSSKPIELGSIALQPMNFFAIH